MSRIERILVHPVSVPLRRPFVTAVRSTRQLETVLVHLVDTDGASGWGEAPASWRVTGESVASITAAVAGPLTEAVVGRDPADLDELTTRIAAAVVRNSSARSAIDCAVHDLAAQRAGLPLQAFLSGRAADRATATATGITTDMTISAGADRDRLVADALEQLAAGFRTLKIKVGAGGGDLDGVRAVRDAVGPDVGLRVDANQAWSTGEAIEIIRAWEETGVALEFVEQPVAARELDALQAVTAEVGTPILADESVWDAGDLREIIHRRAADAVNLKLAKTGGLTAARSMAAAAARASMGVIVGCMMESTVGIGAAAALAGSLGDLTAARPQDLDAGLWLADAAVAGGATYSGDRILLPAEPGAGVAGLRMPDPGHGIAGLRPPAPAAGGSR
ncbi:dipeptide epimerase [Herbiconiux sp. P16]|uniref:dipeptide epimerase n=1 Tax=Herbiconiux wuyangfengii TaxID=3342794 RepID=UPI0035B937BF